MEKDIFKKRNTIINKDSFRTTLLLIQKKMEQKEDKKPNIAKNSSPNQIQQYNYNIRKTNTEKIIKFSRDYKANPRRPSCKYSNNFSSLKYKDKIKHLETLKEKDENISNNKKASKKKYKINNIKTEEKNNYDENITNFNQIPKRMLRSSINMFKLKYDHNHTEEKGKNKIKLIKLRHNKQNANNKKISVTLTKPENAFKCLNNLHLKKDKIELHDTTNQHRSCQKIKNFEQIKKENAKNNEDNQDEEMIKIKKLSLKIHPSEKKIIDSPDRRIYRYSNINNFNSYVINNINQILKDKNNKSYAKKNKKYKD